MPDPIERLTSVFERFPGIGPRQAVRFVQFMLRSTPTLRRELIDAIEGLSGGVRQCQLCARYHAGKADFCNICASAQRDTKYLAVVASDADLAALERSGTYRGHYFVLGGTISLASEKTTNLRIPQLLKSLEQRNLLTEIILAFPANPEGDATATRLREDLVAATAGSTVTITSLGRGLSTGSELEYADADTIQYAIESRR